MATSPDTNYVSAFHRAVPHALTAFASAGMPHNVMVPTVDTAASNIYEVDEAAVESEPDMRGNWRRPVEWRDRSAPTAGRSQGWCSMSRNDTHRGALSWNAPLRRAGRGEDGTKSWGTTASAGQPLTGVTDDNADAVPASALAHEDAFPVAITPSSSGAHSSSVLLPPSSVSEHSQHGNAFSNGSMHSRPVETHPSSYPPRRPSGSLGAMSARETSVLDDWTPHPSRSFLPALTPSNCLDPERAHGRWLSSPNPALPKPSSCHESAKSPAPPPTPPELHMLTPPNLGVHAVELPAGSLGHRPLRRKARWQLWLLSYVFILAWLVAGQVFFFVRVGSPWATGSLSVIGWSLQWAGMLLLVVQAALTALRRTPFLSPITLCTLFALTFLCLGTSARAQRLQASEMFKPLHSDVYTALQLSWLGVAAAFAHMIVLTFHAPFEFKDPLLVGVDAVSVHELQTKLRKLQSQSVDLSGSVEFVPRHVPSPPARRHGSRRQSRPQTHSHDELPYSGHSHDARPGTARSDHARPVKPRRSVSGTHARVKNGRGGRSLSHPAITFDP